MRLRITAQHKLQGQMWYPLAQNELKRVADFYDYPYKIVAGVVAALSPRLHWSRNVPVARACLNFEEKPAGVLSRTWKRACDIRDNAAVRLSGPKVSAFYLALMGGRNSVVLDAWMFRWLAPNDKHPSRRYERYAKLLRTKAKRAGMAPRDFQAAAWLAIRERARTTKTYRRTR